MDLAAAPVLYRDSRVRDVLAFGGTDGYVTGIDRNTHQVIFHTPVTTGALGLPSVVIMALGDGKEASAAPVAGRSQAGGSIGTQHGPVAGRVGTTSARAYVQQDLAH
jgi:hypothetical protein